MNIEASFIVLEPLKICRASEYNLFTHFFYQVCLSLFQQKLKTKLTQVFFVQQGTIA